MNRQSTPDPEPGPLTGIIRFLAIVGLLTIFTLGGVVGIAVYLFLTTG